MKNFIEFNDQNLYFTLIDGEWWVAVKPICDALNVNYNRAAQNIREDEILSQLVAKQQLVAADNRIRGMLCLPEKFVYGWIFSLRSKSKILLQYKRKCYEVLFDYFKGTITQRQKALSDRQLLDVKIEQLEDELAENDKYTQLLELKKQRTQQTKQLNQLDKDLVSNQISLVLQVKEELPQE